MKYSTLAAATFLTCMASSCNAFNLGAAYKRSTTRPTSALGMRRGSLLPSSFFSSGFDDFFDVPLLMGSAMPLLKNFDRETDMTLRRSSPGYEISEDEKQFQLAIDVPGVKASDMKIQVDADARVLRLSGERKVQEGNMSSESQFDKAFRLDRSIDMSNISANLADGVVVVTAPKAAEVKNVFDIPLTENPRLEEAKLKDARDDEAAEEPEASTTKEEELVITEN